MSQSRPPKPPVPLDQAEESRCRTPEEWARLYISKNPDEHALMIAGAYGESRLHRLGPLTINAIQDLQAELGVAGLNPEILAEQRAQSSKRRARRLDDIERLRRVPRAEMLALSDRELHQAALLQLLEDEPGTSNPRMTTSGRRLVAAHMLDADVQNGGFSQYFHNSDGGTADDAIAGLQMIGVEALAEVAKRATTLFREKSSVAGYSLERRDRDFDPLDKEYYALLRRAQSRGRLPPDAVSEGLTRFLRAHLSELWDA